MSKKSWTTLVIVVLIIAAAVAIYFATRPPAEELPSPAPITELTDAPDAVTDAEVDTAITDAPATP